MDQSDRIRGSGILCCHCVSNVAYYKAGWHEGSLRKDTNFWRGVNSNFLDVAVLEWCKLFADPKAKHHWKKVVSNPEAFWESLLQKLGQEEVYFGSYCKQMRVYRDKFLAHLDAERTMQIPEMQLAVDASIILFDSIRADYASILSDAPESLRSLYENCLAEGADQYPTKG